MTLSSSYSITLALLASLPLGLIIADQLLWLRPLVLRMVKFLIFAVCAALVLRASYELMVVATTRPFDSAVAIALFSHIPLALFLCLATWSGGVVSGAKAIGGGTLTVGEDAGGALAALMPQNDSIEALDWDDLVVSREVEKELRSVVELLKDPKSASRYGIDVPKGILLYGPPGTGKTTIAKVMANQAGLSFFALQADQIISKYVGESEKNLSKLFAAAMEHSPSVVFIDEVDSIAAQRGTSNQAWADRVLNHLLQLIDGVIKVEGVYVIAATNRPDMVDDALTRAGRLSRSIEIPLPDAAARLALLNLYCSKLPLAGELNLPVLAHELEGVSPADIRELCNRAGLNAYQREASLGKKQKSYHVTKEDFFGALQEVVGGK